MTRKLPLCLVLVATALTGCGEHNIPVISDAGYLIVDAAEPVVSTVREKTAPVTEAVTQTTDDAIEYTQDMVEYVQMPRIQYGSVQNGIADTTSAWDTTLPHAWTLRLDSGRLVKITQPGPKLYPGQRVMVMKTRGDLLIVTR